MACGHDRRHSTRLPVPCHAARRTRDCRSGIPVAAAAGAVGVAGRSARLQVVVPRMESEPGFEGIATLEGVAAKLKHIARLKYQDVGGQVAHTDHPPCVVAADTVTVAFEADARPVVLGKPPEDEPELVRTVRDWFARYYAGRRHLAMSCVCVGMVGATPAKSSSPRRSGSERTRSTSSTGISQRTNLAARRAVTPFKRPGACSSSGSPGA